MTSNSCSVCFDSVGSHKKTNLRDIVEVLEALLIQINLKLLEELLICDTCLIKVQSACKFKTNYLENSQKLCVKHEDIKNEIFCEICKESVNPSNCIPLFYSVTEIDKLNLFKFLSSELQLKSQDSRQTCELCHKSILNFCIVIRSFSVFVLDTVSIKNVTIVDLKSQNSNSGQDIIVMKKEKTEIKEELEPFNTYEDFLSKNEEFVDLKREDEPICSRAHPEVGIVKCVSYDTQTNKNSHLINHTSTRKNSNEIKILKCQSCNFQTKCNYVLKRHQIVHKSPDEIYVLKCHICDYQTKCKSNLKNHITVSHNIIPHEIEMFKCPICKYQTKYKSHLKGHVIVHKKPDEIEMFKCQICSYQTKYKSDLTKHMATHKTPYKIKLLNCNICDFQTRYKECLKKHLIVHKNLSDTEKFKCPICSYETEFENLKKHIISHKTKTLLKLKCSTS